MHTSFCRSRISLGFSQHARKTSCGTAFEDSTGDTVLVFSTLGVNGGSQQGKKRAARIRVHVSREAARDRQQGRSGSPREGNGARVDGGRSAFGRPQGWSGEPRWTGKTSGPARDRRKPAVVGQHPVKRPSGVLPFRRRPSEAASDRSPAGATSRSTADVSQGGRRDRAVRFFRDVHGTERVWRREPPLETFAEGGDRTEEMYGLVVCSNRHAAGAR